MRVEANDIYTIFTPFEQHKVDGKLQRGRWCTLCRLVWYLLFPVQQLTTKSSAMKKGERAFYLGGNSTLRGHLRRHWDEYEKRCKAKGYAVDVRAMPPKVLAEKQRLEAEVAAVARGKDGNPGTLEMHFEKRRGPREFSKESVLANVAKYITCCDKVRYDGSYATKGTHLICSHSPLQTMCSIAILSSRCAPIRGPLSSLPPTTSVSLSITRP